MSKKSRLHSTREEIIHSIKTQQQGRSIPCQGIWIGDWWVIGLPPGGRPINKSVLAYRLTKIVSFSPDERIEAQ